MVAYKTSQLQHLFAPFIAVVVYFFAKVVQASEICKVYFAISYNERSLSYQKVVQASENPNK